MQNASRSEITIATVTALFVSVTLLIASVLLGPQEADTGTLPSSPNPSSVPMESIAPSGSQTSSSDETFSIESWSVKDGDTVSLSICLSKKFGITVKSDCRLLGVDCAEKGSSAGKETVEVVKEWMARQERLSVTNHKDDKFGGRFLGDIFNPVSGEQLRDFLLSNQLARPYMGEKKQPWSQQELDQVLSKAKSLRETK